MDHVADEVPWMMMYGWVCLTGGVGRSTICQVYCILSHYVYNICNFLIDERSNEISPAITNNVFIQWAINRQNTNPSPLLLQRNMNTDHQDASCDLVRYYSESWIIQCLTCVIFYGNISAHQTFQFSGRVDSHCEAIGIGLDFSYEIALILSRYTGIT